ncbi:MAG: alpha/beta fold hydrolase [Deltaproteobacteria bacterium]|jgi:pimeloyl-ACP methyl ester carboxylesterase|nr:alpha/beta fold hydrolase [Deltaproteobacteria bacterium]MBW2537834.1 alpha/beta fold hydrolase [Deltaproteobacteria bacterium]
MASLLDRPVLSERYFFPRREMPEGPLRPVDVGDASLSCLHVPAEAGRPTVLFFHGNGEVVADYWPWLVDAWRQRGFGVMLAEYRGYGGSTGTPCLVGMLDDVDALLAATGCADGEVLVFGRSVGSIYALELARRHPTVAGLVLESGIADVLERIRLRVRPAELGTTDEGLAAEVAAHLDHRAKLDRYRGPLLVMHAAGDSLVDCSHGQRLASWGSPDDTELVLLDQGDHNSVMMLNWSEYWRTIDRFVARLFPPSR